MSDIIKLGPLWNRGVFDGKARVVKFRGRTVCRYDDIQAFRLREYIAAYEEVELQNLHPEVQKAPRDAELWLELKDGRSVLAAVMEQAGLLLSQVSPVATSLGLPVRTERSLVADAPVSKKAS